MIKSYLEVLLEDCQNGNVKIVQTLLEHGVNVYKKDENNKTALDLASEFGHVEVVNVLVNWMNDY